MIPEQDRPVVRAVVVRNFSALEDWLEQDLSVRTNLNAADRAEVIGRLRNTFIDEAFAFPIPKGTVEARLQAAVVAKDRALLKLTMELISRELHILDLERKLQAADPGSA